MLYFFFNFRDNLSLIYDHFLVSFVFFCVIIYCILGNFYNFFADIIAGFFFPVKKNPPMKKTRFLPKKCP